MGKPKVLDLFSGIGVFPLVFREFGCEVAHLVEIEPFCQSVLAVRFPGVPITPDVRHVNCSAGDYDIITAGFPCQDNSKAGARKAGLAGARSGLIWEVLRITSQCRPRYLVLENVPNLLYINEGRDFRAILWALFQIGFDAEWEVISSCALGAPHTRERLFILAYPHRIDGRERLAFRSQYQGKLPIRDRRAVPKSWRFPPGGTEQAADGPAPLLAKDRINLLQAIGNSLDCRAASLVASAVMGQTGRFFSYG